MTETDTYPENKLLILYILNKVNSPITNSVLTKIYFTINELNYFYFQQYLADLIKKDFVNTFEENNTNFYMITEKGLNTLNELMYLIPSVLLVTADKALESITKGLKYELSITSDFIILDIDKINVKCNISEGNSLLFSLEIFAGTMEQARKIADNWKQNALKHYPQIIQLLTNENQE